MKNIFLGIIREIGIAIVILVILAAVIALAFKDQLPYNVEVPTGENYVRANLKSYSVSSTDRISEVNAITITHEASQGNIKDAESEIRIQTGKYTPFATINGVSDLPTEKVGSTAIESMPTEVSSTKNSADSSKEATSSESDNDMIRKIEQEQSEDASSAANRRFGNEE